VFLFCPYRVSKTWQIALGVKGPPEVVEADEMLARRVCDGARKRLTREPITKLAIIETDVKPVAVTDVQRSAAAGLKRYIYASIG